MSEIISLEKKGGLNKIRSHGKSASALAPKLFKQDSRDPSSQGDLQGEYKGKTLPDSKHFLSPHWDRQWVWGSTPEKFNELQIKLDLKYWKGHIKEGQDIPQKDFSLRVKNKADDIFNHPSFYGKVWMDNGHVNLNTDDPVKEFLAYCYKGYTNRVDDKSSGAEGNKYISSGTTYVMKTSKSESSVKVKNLDKKVEANNWVFKLKGDEDRLRTICEIMTISGYSKATSVEGCYLLIADAAENTSKLTKYDGKTSQERFIELASQPSEQLDLIKNILIAKDKGFIRIIKNKGMVVDGENISGVFNETKMIDYMLNPKNQELYSKLIDFIENA